MSKRFNSRRWIGTIAAAAAMLMSVGTLTVTGTQEEERPGPRRPGFRGGPAGGFGEWGPPEGFEHWRMVRELNLTEEQQQKMRELRQSHFEQTRNEREDMAEAHEAFREAVRGGDPVAIEEAGVALGKAHAALAIAGSGHRKELLEVLTPDQQKKWEKMRAEMEEFQKQRREHMKTRFEKLREERPYPEPELW